jgi:hypothetical protein
MRAEHLAFALLALAGVAGCGGGGATGGSSCNGFVAVALPAPPSMLSPAPGASGLSSSVTVEISYQPPGGSLRAVPEGGGATVSGSAFAPAPGATSVAQTVDSTLSALAAHTTYEVYVDAVYPPEPACTEGERAGPTTFDVGSLSTQ